MHVGAGYVIARVIASDDEIYDHNQSIVTLSVFDMQNVSSYTGA